MAACAIRQNRGAAGVQLNASKQALKQSAPAKWRQYLLGVWRRNQKKLAVALLYDSKLRIAERLLTHFVAAHPDLTLPVTFDSWYTEPGSYHYLDLHQAYVGP